MDSIRESNRGNRSGSTSTFKPPTERSVMVAPDPLPGPADYRVHRELDADYPIGGGGSLEDSVFRSRTTRGHGAKAGAHGGPAPGQYNPSISGSSGHDGTQPTAAFRSGVPIAGRTPTSRITREQQLGVVSALPSANPGPGEYDLPVSSLASHGYRRTPQFHDSNHDRFGRALAGAAPTVTMTTPGPGSYIHDSEPHTAVISGSVFMSGTKRDGRHARDVVPGPAYYSPAPDAKKSFHLNARSRWIPST